jgi:hypothetical protein
MPRKSPTPPHEVPGTPSGGADAGVSSKVKELLKWEDLPPEYSGGKPNPEHDRAILAAFTKVFYDAVTGGHELGKGINPDQLKNFVLARAKMRGIEPRGLMDARSEGDKLQDAVDRLIEAPESLFEMTDADLEIMQREFEGAIEKCSALIDSRRPDLTDDEQRDREVKRFERGKEWLGRIQKEQRLRDWMRVPAGQVPKGVHLKHRLAFSAAKRLFVMVKIMRSSMPAGLRPGSDSMVCMIADHHARFAVDTWEAETGAEYTIDGVKYGQPFRGVLLIAPPGHGKSQFAAAFAGRDIGENPKTQITYLHAQDDMAQTYHRYIVMMFDAQHAMGRRMRAIYPKAVYKHHNSGKLWLELAEGAKTPTLQASGMTSKKLGTDSHKQIWDDIVPQSDRDQPTERERRFKILSGTWNTRQRGSKTFVMCIGTLWHNDDALSKFARLSETERYFLVSRQKCGGPNTTPQFDPLWKEVYPASELRSRFIGMNRDHDLWSANYMANPKSETTRLIRKLRFYDPDIKEHEDFMASAQLHISVDPTATNRETSDHAGLMYVGLGEVLVGQDGPNTRYETRLRILSASRVHLNQIELTEFIKDYALQRPVYQTHLEVHSTNGSATRDLLRHKYDLEVIEHAPTNKSKGIRLKSCAGVIDDSANDFRAVVEFPGQWRVVVGDDGKTVKNQDGSDKMVLVARDDMVEVEKQLVDFGVHGADEFPDCLSQITNHFLRSTELVAGSGETTRTIQAAVKQHGDPRILAMLKQYENGTHKQTVEEEDDQWLRQLHSRAD